MKLIQRLNDLFKVTKLVSAGAGFPTQVCLTPNLCSIWPSPFLLGVETFELLCCRRGPEVLVTITPVDSVYM